ncbi:hypothetical protein EYZ11_008157 [Aspergillus tanneri]|uniref:Uncharacterized protein n=1 Tax=Aspergillus tanneri TaxID=1220188 RepID=A0A4S3JDC4_9EURO|nr:uncharacterized protein ATNIH1004_009170 [Aspergillus tanneri]KAA8644959.1 hypothetical protein ATNIH1004_009170 [Aspergillus tanneri]THC92367.1 hypothetical protein EYZ11_008157 [Aspergillus tanneri]
MPESSNPNSTTIPAGTGTGGSKKRAGSPLEASNAWVADIIREATTRQVHEELKAIFLNGAPDMAAATAFFKEINQKIRNANTEHNTDSENGIIPEYIYQEFYSTWLNILDKAKAENNAEAAWQGYDHTYQKFQTFNREYSLPEEWNIGTAFVEQHFGPRVIQSVEHNDNNPLPEGNLPEHIDDNDSDVTELDELEANTRQDMSFSDGEVLFWWKRGTGSQVYVRYGSGSKSIYRIRAGSYEAYDPDGVPCLFSTSKRGQEREMFTNSQGRLEERLKYKREDVHGIIGVGWKIEDDDEEGLEPLDLIWPEPYAKYPHTRVLVQWKDKEVTLEDRTFIRRITRGSSLQGDRVIYQKALTQEVRFRRDQGLPYEHLLDRIPGMRQTSLSGDEDLENEVIGDESPEVDHAEPGTADRVSVRPGSVRPASHRERSKASEVRFVEQPREPSTRATPRRGSIRPTPNRAYSKSAERDDARAAEINFLRRQIETMQKAANSRSAGRRASKWAYDDRYDDGESDIEYAPEPSQRQRRAQRGKVWDNWAGRWFPAGRTY